MRPVCPLVPRLLATVLLACATQVLPAATYLPMPDAKLAARSPVIVRARVISFRAALETIGNISYPFTTVSLERIESLKGKIPRHFRVRLPGGRLGDVAWSLPGTPAFSPGQEVVLFLEPLPRYSFSYRLTEFGLSKFDIVADSKGGRFAVRPVFDAAADDALSGRFRDVRTERPGAVPLRRRANSFLAALRNGNPGLAWPVEYGKPSVSTSGEKHPAWVNIGGVEGNDLFRWFWDTGDSPNATVTTTGTQASLSDGSTGATHVQNAVDQWRSVADADVRYGGLAPSGNVVVHLGATSSFDGGATWNTPLTCGSGGIIGLGGPGTSSGPRTFKGESPYFAPSSGTVSMREMSGPAGCYDAALFRAAVLHEVGHTLGLGHSDSAASIHSTDSATSIAAANAVMHSVIPSANPSTPQPDDILAIQYYYGSSAVVAPSASFTAPGSATVGQSVAFADASTGSPTWWAWNFGDGSISKDRNPIHTFGASGTFSVTLTAGNSGGSSQASRSITIFAQPIAGGAGAATLPVAGHVTGEGGTVFITDVVIQNPNPFPVDADLLFFPVGGGASRHFPLGLRALETRALPDVVASAFGVTNSFGALRLETAGAPPLALRMTSRTYDEVGGGSFGMAVSGVPDSGSPAPRIVTGLERDPECRSSVGAVNWSAADGTFRVTLRGPDGGVLGTSAAVTLPPGGQWQVPIGDLFPGAAGPALTAEFESADGSAVPFAYGTLVDNRSGDPTYFPSLRPATRLTLPVLSRVTGIGGALFVSDLTLANPSDAPAAVTLVFRERNRDNTSGSPHVSVFLGARETRLIGDALATLFGGSETFGALEISSDSPVAVSERISTASPTTAGTVGQQVDPIPADGFYLRASILGLRQDASFRSNVGIVNPNDGAASVQLVLRRPDGTSAAVETIGVPPHGLVQSPLPALFPAAPFSAGALWTITLDSAERIAAYAIVADNVSQDLTASPAIP